MNKKLMVVVVGLVLVIGGALAYVWLKPDNSVDTTKQAPDQSKPSPASNTPPDNNVQPGAYVPYSSEAVSATTGTKLLFFHAPWCPQCRQIEDSINKDGLPPGVTIFKVDYDSSQALRQRYSVTIQTTFVKIDDNGDRLTSYVAYEEPHFRSVQRELLP